jgi:hypothetical protein
MNLMRKAPGLRRRFSLGLIPGLLFFGGGNALHASVDPSSFFSSLLQQQSGKAGGAPESDAPSPADDQTQSLGDQVIQDVLEPLRTGMETQDIQQVLSVFDRQELSGYSDLQAQLRAFFRQFAEVRLRYQILQVTADSDHGSATAELDMDALPYDVTQTPARRSVQMRFRLKLEAKAWKVVSFTPSDFFNLGFNRADPH